MSGVRAPNERDAWIIVRKADHSQWGVEDYASHEEAARELQSFWKGVPRSSSIIAKFDIVQRSEQRPVRRLTA